MKTPTNIGGNNLVTWLQSATEIRMADLYTITLKNGTALRYTSWDTNLTVLGNTFLTGPPNIARSAIEEKLGMDVATLEVTIEASLSDVINGVPILQAIGQGLFDGAAFRIDRLFMDSASNQIGTVVRFSGFIGALDELTRSAAKLSVNAGTAYLSMQLPAVILQPGCTNTLFDARCGLVKASFAEANMVQAGITVNKLISLSAKDRWLLRQWANCFYVGRERRVGQSGEDLRWAAVYFQLSAAVCPERRRRVHRLSGMRQNTSHLHQNKFSNLVNFEGFPYVPAPETAI